MQHGCHTLTPRPHPWEPRILDVACGDLLKLADPACCECHRARGDMPGEQLLALGAKLHPGASLPAAQS